MEKNVYLLVNDCLSTNNNRSITIYELAMKKHYKILKTALPINLMVF